MDQEKNKSIDEAVKRAEAKHKNIVSDLERFQMQQKMRDKARDHLVNHAVTEWTLVRSLAWSERIIVFVALALIYFNPAQHIWSFSTFGFLFFSLAFLGPVYGIMMFLSLLVIYRVYKKLHMYPTDSKGFKKIIYPTYIIWTPVIFAMSHYAMNFYYELISTIPAWDSGMKLWESIKGVIFHK